MSKQVMQQGLDALEYHTEQTRPIAQTEQAIEDLRAAIAAPEPEPVVYQSRMRPMWGRMEWQDWAECSKGCYEEYKSTPTVNDWELEARALYLTQPETEALRAELERVKGERDAILRLSHEMDDRASGITELQVYDLATKLRVLIGLDGPEVAIAAQKCGYGRHSAKLVQALESVEALLLSMGMESSDAYQEITAALNASDADIAAQGEGA